MKKTGLIFCFILLFLSVVSGKKNAEKLLMGGSGWNKIVIIDKKTKQIEWEHPLERGWECNSVVAAPDGNILFTYARGAKMITRDHQEVWNIPAPDNCEMQTARLLPDGNFLLAWVGHPAVIMEVNAKGDILSRTEYEISPSGELVRVTKLEGTLFTTLAMKNGNYWVACGDGHALMEVDLDEGKVVRCYEVNDFKGIRLFFVAGLLPARRNGLYICNWQGHDKYARKANSPQVFEIDAKGNVVWSLNDSKNFGMISTISSVY